MLAGHPPVKGDVVKAVKILDPNAFAHGSINP
jgi:hypothetical protein